MTLAPEQSNHLRVLAFYLPQFHVIPENEHWWGTGFTEWTNVRRAAPLFEGHAQPRVPGELGYYDLTDPEVRSGQAALAAAHGVDGFVYYHYWFHGRRLLHQPLDEMLERREPDFPFCLCWANENWTRSWDGGSHQVLVPEQYSDDDDVAHARWLANAFCDPRYVRVDGKPLFLVYRAKRLPDARRTTDTWRRELSRLGVGDVYLARVENFPEERGDPTELGFDAGVEFQPDWMRPGRTAHLPALETSAAPIPVRDYRLSVALALTQPHIPWRRFRSVTPGFDNTPRRRERPVVYTHATPAMYARFLHGVIDTVRRASSGEELVFVNAWNEWGEGNYLEPDLLWGRGFLEAHRAARRGGTDLDALQRSADEQLMELAAQLNGEVASLSADAVTWQHQRAELASLREERAVLRAAVEDLDAELGALQRSRSVRIGAAVGALNARVRAVLRKPRSP